MTNQTITSHEKIAVIGLGYVGLPLAINLAKHFTVVGFDVDNDRIESLRKGFDSNSEFSSQELSLTSLTFTSTKSELSGMDVYILALPTPVDDFKQPDLTCLLEGTALVADYLAPGNMVVYESTVYPGVTEDKCGELLTSLSGFRVETDFEQSISGPHFQLAYSPERINPGDETHNLASVIKVISAASSAAATRLADIYRNVCHAGIHIAPSIKVAEAAKVIENAQRDINIAFVNELSQIMCSLGIDTNEVLDAASTKWNFHRYSPGLVGGHCIGVDPYYLAYISRQYNYEPNIILSGRKINDQMHIYVATKVIRFLAASKKPVSCSSVLVLGQTFKENCPDRRNSKNISLAEELRTWGVNVVTHDPFFELPPVNVENIGLFDVIILAVPHKEYLSLASEVYASLFFDPTTGCLFDIKGALDRGKLKQAGLFNYFSL